MRKEKQLLIGLICMICILGGSATVQAAVKIPSQVKNVKATAYGTSSHRISWKKISGVTGYQIYCRDYSSSSKLYKKVKTVSGASRTSCTITGRKAGKAYSYMVRAYKKVGKKVYYGKLSSYAYGYIKKTTASTANTTNQNSGTSSTTNSSNTSNQSQISSKILVNPTTAQKYKLVFGDASLKLRYPGGYYTSSSKAAANMVSITVKTWDFKNGKSGEKITRTWTIKVHKNLAETYKQIFKEIYEGKEQFPIHELGGYEWRGGHSEHNTGTAVDINWTENYMVNVATGKITAGKYWKPGADPYSIPKDGEVAKIFAKYGFSQGDWGNSKDYMHFSYFGT